MKWLTLFAILWGIAWLYYMERGLQESEQAMEDVENKMPFEVEIGMRALPELVLLIYAVAVFVIWPFVAFGDVLQGIRWVGHKYQSWKRRRRAKQHLEKSKEALHEALKDLNESEPQ